MEKINFDIRGTKNNFIVNLIAMSGIAISGLVMSFSYYVLSILQAAFEKVQCLIPDNVYFSTCQEWFTLTLYPVLNLKYIFIWASYFYIFGVVLGLFFIGFRTKKHPALFSVHIIMSIIFGYLSIEIANIYRTLLGNPLMYDILVPFSIYNKIMLYFPQFMFFVIFLSGIIGFMGIIKGKYKEGIEEI